MNLRSDCEVGAEVIELPSEWRDGKLVHICPPVIATGALELRNRGLNLPYEVTCWPRPKTSVFRLTTGGGERPRHLCPSAHELWTAAQISKTEVDFKKWAERWREEARALARRREKEIPAFVAVASPLEEQAVDEVLFRKQPTTSGGFELRNGSLQ